MKKVYKHIIKLPIIFTAFLLTKQIRKNIYFFILTTLRKFGCHGNTVHSGQTDFFGKFS